jgi:Ras-related GTP-binding protein A/B
VEILIFVFDVTSKDFPGDLAHYETCLAALSDLSKGARIFCLVHKMDLLQESDREAKF